MYQHEDEGGSSVVFDWETFGAPRVPISVARRARMPCSSDLGATIMVPFAKHGAVAAEHVLS